MEGGDGLFRNKNIYYDEFIPAEVSKNMKKKQHWTMYIFYSPGNPALQETDNQINKHEA